jgi:ribosome-associated protein
MTTDIDDNTQSYDEPMIRLEQFMKRMNVVASGGQAKMFIQSGQVLVNSVVETRRKRQLHAGDKVEFMGEAWIVESESPEN